MIKGYRDLEVWQKAMNLCEVETQLLLSVRLGFAQMSDVEKIMDSVASVGRMLKALQRSLSTQKPRNQAA